MTDRASLDKVMNAVIEMMAGVSEAIVDPVIEATQGYRTKMEVAGFSPTMAEQLAASYHVELLRLLFSQMAAQQHIHTVTP
jgi:hypothetical protein